MPLYTPISTLNSNSSFYDWFTKENNEIIAKLNLINAYNITSGDGITAPIDANGLATISLSGKVDQGISFNGPAYFNNFAAIPNIAIRVDGITSGTNSFGYTFGMPVRVFYDTATNSVQYEPARSIDPDSAEVFGVISLVNNSYSYVTLIGKIDGNFSQVNDRGIGLTAGWIYFLSGVTGHITDLEPITTGYVSKPVIMGISGSSGLVLQMRGNYLNPNIQPAGVCASNKIIFASDVDMRPKVDIGNFVSIYTVLGTNAFGALKDYFFNSGLTYAKILNSTFSLFANSYLVPSVPTVSVGITGPTPNSRFVKNDSDHVIGMVTDIKNDGVNYYYEVLQSGYTTVLPRYFTGDPTTTADGVYYLNHAFNPKVAISGDGAVPSSDANKQFIEYQSIGSGSEDQLVRSEHVAGIRYGDTFIIVNKHNYKDSTLYSTYFPSGAPALQSSTSVSGANGNILINGNFQVWQRGNIGRNSYYTNTGNVIFADLWRRHDGITGGNSFKSYHIIRQEFDEYQNAIEGNPEYYLNVKAIGLSAIGMTGATLYSQTDHLMIGHVIPGAKRLDKNTVNVKFYGKCTQSGYDVDLYISRYTGITLIDYKKLGTATLSTTWTPYTLSDYLEPLENEGIDIDLDNDYTEIGLDFHPLIYQANLNGITLGHDLTVSIASVSASINSNATISVYPDFTDQLKYCQQFYYTSYDINQTPGSITMSDTTTPTQNLESIFIQPNKTCNLLKWPTRMRTLPTVSFYSPLSGVLGDAYNKTATLDLRNTSGTSGYSGARRSCPIGAITIRGSSSVHGVNVCIDNGMVNYDEIYYHIIADADFTI